MLTLVSLLLLTKLGKTSGSYSNCSKPLSYENETNYELVYFNLDKFTSFGIIEFDYNNIHYSIKLIKNDHISPIINHQTDKNILITHDKIKPDDLWYVYNISHQL